MIKALFVHLIILLLTVTGLFFTFSKSILIIIAAFLMIINSIIFLKQNEEEKFSFRDFLLFLLCVILAFAFSFISNCFFCYLIFLIIFPIKVRFQTILGISAYIFAYFFIYQKEMDAILIIDILIIVICFALSFGLKSIFDLFILETEKSKIKLKDVTISELHTKQLNDELVMNSFLVDKNARLLERENISRNIHNSVGHSITAAIMTLDAADLLYDYKPDEARQKMNDANERIRGSLDSIRRAVRVLDDNSRNLSIEDLKCELQEISNSFMLDTTKTIKIDYTEMPKNIMLPHEHFEFLTGVFEELLTNGIRHGNATCFVLLLSGDKAHIQMVVSDNGVSDFCPSNERQRIDNGFGLKKIIAYVKRCGGKALFTNSNGFRAEILLPIYDDNRKEEEL